MPDSYLHPAAIELAALTTFIRVGHVTDAMLREENLFRGVSLFESRTVKQGYIQACRPIVNELLAVMMEKRFFNSVHFKTMPDQFISAMVHDELTAKAIHIFITRYAQPPDR